MSCIPSPKTAKLFWAKQLPRLPCLMVYVKFQFVDLIKVENDLHIFLNIARQILQYKCTCLELENYSPFTDTSKAIAYSVIPLIK